MMELDANLFLHDSDKAAMAALKAIPGFHQVTKAFMKVWSEKQSKIINMSSNLKLSENQLAKYYNMLPPICEKLGIEVPELYVELNVHPNAYTSGDTNPYIVITSGLFETLPDELIPSVLAHECGHIVCHHTLYRTMGFFLLSGASSFMTGIGNIALYPIQIAFAYWMRCSEYSADRVAAICDGNADKVIDFCMRFAGYDKDIMADANVDLFLQQAEEYREMVHDSAWNKTLEFLLFKNNDHPLNAVRAYECREWANSERFVNILEYINSPSDLATQNLPVLVAPKKYIGRDVNDVQAKLLSKGFADITLYRVTEAKSLKNGAVVDIKVNDETAEEDYFKKTAKINITYYEEKSFEEISLEHPGEICIDKNYKYYNGKIYTDIIEELQDAGFTNIITKEMAIPKLGILIKENTVAKITIDSNSQFDKNEWYKPNVEILIYYYIDIK